MATIQARNLDGLWGARRSDRRASSPYEHRLRAMLSFAGGVLGAVFAAELVLPEADPAQVRALLVELGRLEAAAPPAERVEALRVFQADSGLPVDGVADGRTVSALTRDVREHRALRALGLPV